MSKFINIFKKIILKYKINLFINFLKFIFKKIIKKYLNKNYNFKDIN